MIQIIDNLDHRSKKPNFVRDQFDTLQAMKVFPETDVDEGHISYCIETKKHYRFNTDNLTDETTGKWREFKGEKGDPGQPGKDGASISSYFTAFIFRSSEIEPGTPTGGSWDPSTNVVTPPTSWALKDSDLSGTIWMSWGVFTPQGTIRDAWATPIRLTGEDGRNGTDGKSIEFIYKLANREPTPDDRPGSVNTDDYVPAGWTDNPTGISVNVQYEWMCMRENTEGYWSDWHGPTIWSRWGFDGRDGDGVEFIYKRTISSTAPDRPTDIVQEDEFVPDEWSDNPTGVDANHMYEWVSIRKFKNSQWGAFGPVALWAKWGEKGEPGKDGSDGTSINIKGTVDSVSDLPSSAQPGDAYVVGDYLYVWDGIRWQNVGAMKGPAGDSAYVHIAFADGVTTNSQGVVTNVYGFTTSGSTNKAWFGTCADHNVADPTDPFVYKWQNNKGEKGDKGDQGPQGVPGPAGEGGVTLYTWIRYADDIQGNGISNNPDGKKYIGLAYNKTSYTESNDPSDYIWTAIDDTGGAPSGGGLYTWIKYADAIPKTDTDVIYDIPNDGTMYIGIAVNQETKVESTNGLLYTWSLFRGKDGSNGRIIYPAGIYDATITYTATDAKAPYVVHGDNYYVMNKTTSWLGSSTGKTPQENYDEFGSLATWIPMEKFNAVYTNILMADYGKLSKFIFYGDYMYSQGGTDSSGAASDSWQEFGKNYYPFKWTDRSVWGDNTFETSDSVTFEDYRFIINKFGSTPLKGCPIYPKIANLPGFGIKVTNLPSNCRITYTTSNINDPTITYFLEIKEDGEYYIPKSIPEWNATGVSEGFYFSVPNSQITNANVIVELLTTEFTPNFQINAVTGEVHMQNAYIEGSLISKTNLYEILPSDIGNAKALQKKDINNTVIFYSRSNDISSTDQFTLRIWDAFQPAGEEMYNAGYVYGNFTIINLTNGQIKVTDLLGRIYPTFVFAGKHNVSSVTLKKGGCLKVMTLVTRDMAANDNTSGISHYVLNQSDFDIASDAYNAISKTY